MLRTMGTAAAVIVVFFCLLQCTLAQRPPKEYVKLKCEKRIKNETLLRTCKECVDGYKLPEYPARIDVKNMIKECVPKKDPKKFVKGICDHFTDIQEELEACFQCVDVYPIPINATKDDVRAMKRTCLPKPTTKFQAKRKCTRRLRTEADIEACKTCIENYALPERASCEEVKEMRKICITERSGRELWSEPLMKDDFDDDEIVDEE